MLSLRTEKILKSIVGEYIARATPVPSHSVTESSGLNVSSATIRNEMAFLEHEGYITRPHTSAGSVPLDKGYRLYVESLGDVLFPLEEQRLISHVFHQVELELQRWLNLTATLTAQKAQNVALVSLPKTEFSRFKHLELVKLQDSLALMVLVLSGARVRQQLISSDEIKSQDELTQTSNRLNDLYSGLTSSQISDLEKELSDLEKKITNTLQSLMEKEDAQDSDDPFLDGLHFTLNQPEFVSNQSMSRSFMELMDQRNLLRNILVNNPGQKGVQVIIGEENEIEAVKDFSIVIGKYGLPGEAEGAICVLGPTRMNYIRTIATVNYLSQIMSGLVARLYSDESEGGAEKDMPVK